MIKNYLKIALRSLWKNRIFTGLNVFGLTAAFAVAFLLGMYAYHKLSYDQFHENKAQLYQIYTNKQTPRGTESSTTTPVPFAAALQEEVPGVKYVTRYKTGGPSLEIEDKTFRVGALWTDPDFFKMFTFPLVQGDARNFLEDQSSAVITQKGAQRIFGTEDVIGKTLDVPNNGANKPVVITAVMKDYPIASSITPEIIFNFKNLPEDWYKRNADNWNHHNHSTFVQLEEATTPENFEKATQAFSQLHFENDISNAKRDGATPDANGNYQQIKLLPVTDLSFANDTAKVLTVSKSLEYFVIGVALLILLIASVNFINMSIAKGANRLREIGMRKTLGASKKQLFGQFWGESILVFLVSMMLGGILATLLLKPFQTLFRTQATFEQIINLQTLSGLIFGLFIVTLIAGGYPAYLMSKLGTVQALKGKLATRGQNRLRNVLIVVQFAIAIVLISGTLILKNQLAFMATKDLGFNKEQVISFPLGSAEADPQIMDRFRNILSTNPSVLSITASDANLGLGKDNSSRTSISGFGHQGRELKTHLQFVDYDYLKTLDIDLLEGRSFDASRPSDTLSVIINKAMYAQFSEESPLDLMLELAPEYQFKVIGLIEDFNFQSISKNVEPLSIFLDRNDRRNYAYIKVRPENLNQTFKDVEKAWNTLVPTQEFLGSFLDENIERTLRRERLMTTMITSGSILAIILSCLGLFAMSLLVVAQRRKEIGIRKVVGASVSNITVLLTKDFLKLVAIAFVIATPIAWYMADGWLQNYASHIDLTFWLFMISGGIAVLIALATISVKTITAAVANPVKSLRTE